MKQFGNDRVASRPEHLYDLLPTSLTAWQDARPHIIRLLGLESTAGMYDISQTITARYPEARAPYLAIDIGKRIVELVTRYPFLAPPMYRHATLVLSGNTFDGMVGDHYFDDFPGIYGISRIEGHTLRARVNGRNFGDGSYVQFCQAIGLDTQDVRG